MRNERFIKYLSLLDYSSKCKAIRIDRMLALRNSNNHLVDTNYKWTIFSQMFNELHMVENQYFVKKENSAFVEVNLIGENASDAGGPRREILSAAFTDLNSDSCQLFIPTPNNVSKSGKNREKFTINPEAKSKKE